MAVASEEHGPVVALELANPLEVLVQEADSRSAQLQALLLAPQ
jgi:hypothetical protein